MAILDQITQMKNQGIPDEQIISNLQQQGISPQEISNAFSQAQIKNAVAGEPQTPGEYVPQTQEAYTPSAQQPPPQQAYAQQQEPYPQDAYAQQQAYPPQGGGYGEQYPQQPPQGGGMGSTDTTIEVAEQVFSEKIKKTEKQLREFSEFKNLAQTKINNFEERLKRIETTIDKLQITILEKIGSYGKDIENTRKEMSMMRDSFGKVINPLVSKASEKQAAPKKK